VSHRLPPHSTKFIAAYEETKLLQASGPALVFGIEPAPEHFPTVLLGSNRTPFCMLMKQVGTNNNSVAGTASA
jgi:hypothetical protein